jgi:outer membrane protein assembly factor BamA
VQFSIGPTYQFYEMDNDDKLNQKRFINQTGFGAGKNGLDSAVLFSKQKYLGIYFSLDVDTRNNKVFPEKGIVWHNSLRYLGGMGNTPYSPTIINSDFSFYLKLIHDRLTFADRIGAGTTLGSFNFHQAQYLGNNEDLRGYRKDRFAGKSKFYNQAELRWRLANFKTYLFPGALGFVFFLDAGRVWVNNDSESGFPVGYGAGFWFSPLRRILISINYGMSKEDKIAFVTMGWRF